MSELLITEHPRVKSKFEKYPRHIRKRMEELRTLILQTATEIEHIDKIEETLKWEEPSYIAEKGSTIRN